MFHYSTIHEDISNNRAGAVYTISAGLSGCIALLCFFLLPVPFNFIIGAIGGIASIGLGVTALYKNNQQAKELQQAVLDTNTKVNKITPMLENTTTEYQQTYNKNELENNNKKNIQNNEYLYNNKQINNNNSVINIPTIQSEQTKQRG
ncbi:MAG: hypothetical protein IJT15_04045 [Rickettsiales bacterium]|nr:hypothetical protein [Rickettsiales bacterium]